MLPQSGGGQGRASDHADADVRGQAVLPAGRAHPRALGVVVRRALRGRQQRPADLLRTRAPCHQVK